MAQFLSSFKKACLATLSMITLSPPFPPDISDPAISPFVALLYDLCSLCVASRGASNSRSRCAREETRMMMGGRGSRGWS